MVHPRGQSKLLVEEVGVFPQRSCYATQSHKSSCWQPVVRYARGDRVSVQMRARCQITPQNVLLAPLHNHKPCCHMSSRTKAPFRMARGDGSSVNQKEAVSRTLSLPHCRLVRGVDISVCFRSWSSVGQRANWLFSKICLLRFTAHYGAVMKKVCSVGFCNRSYCGPSEGGSCPSRLPSGTSTGRQQRLPTLWMGCNRG